MYKTHRQNHNFQIAHFLAGSCHTPDGAYAILNDLLEERQAAIDNYAVSQLKQKAKEIRTKRLLESEDEAKKLEGEAEMLELENGRKTGAILYKAACDERDYIIQCIEAVQPYRKYKDLPDPEAFEAAQQEEWKLELIYRAENYLLTTGTISPDHFTTMRMHPEFKEVILPKIKEIQVLMQTPGGVKQLEEDISKSQFKLLG